MLRLTVKGRRLAEALAPVWEEIRAANRLLLDELRAGGHDLLENLAAIVRHERNPAAAGEISISIPG